MLDFGRFDEEVAAARAYDAALALAGLAQSERLNFPTSSASPRSRPTARAADGPAYGGFAPGLVLKAGDVVSVFSSVDEAWYAVHVVGPVKASSPWIAKAMACGSDDDDDDGNVERFRIAKPAPKAQFSAYAHVGDWVRVHHTNESAKADETFRLCYKGLVCVRPMDARALCGCAYHFDEVPAPADVKKTKRAVSKANNDDDDAAKAEAGEANENAEAKQMVNAPKGMAAKPQLAAPAAVSLPPSQPTIAVNDKLWFTERDVNHLVKVQEVGAAAFDLVEVVATCDGASIRIKLHASGSARRVGDKKSGFRCSWSRADAAACGVAVEAAPPATALVAPSSSVVAAPPLAAAAPALAPSPAPEAPIVTSLSELVGGHVWLALDKPARDKPPADLRAMLCRVVNLKDAASNEALLFSLTRRKSFCIVLELDGRARPTDSHGATVRLRWRLATSDEVATEAAPVPTPVALPVALPVAQPAVVVAPDALAPKPAAPKRPVEADGTAPKKRRTAVKKQPAADAEPVTATATMTATTTTSASVCSLDTPAPPPSPKALALGGDIGSHGPAPSVDSLASRVAAVAVLCLVPSDPGLVPAVAALKALLAAQPDKASEGSALLGKMLAANMLARRSDLTMAKRSVAALATLNGALEGLAAGVLDTLAVWAAEGRLEADRDCLETAGAALFLSRALVQPVACVRSDTLSTAVARLLRVLEDRMTSGKGDAFILARQTLVEWVIAPA